MTINAPRTKKSAATAVAGLFVFRAGLAVLRFNPFWRHEPARGGALDHHVYAWVAVGHLICAVGLLSAFGALIYLVSTLFTTKWLYAPTVVFAAAVLITSLGVSRTYSLRWVWEANAGVTEITVFEMESQPANWIWQTIVRWQIEPDLNGWLSVPGSIANAMKRSHGYLEIRVMRIVPVVGPTTLDCDCFGCCREDAGSAPSGC